MEIVKVPGGFILKISEEATVTHQEHKKIKLSPGLYRVGHEREVDYFANAVVRKVID